MFGDIDFFTSGSVRNKSGRRMWLTFLSLLEAEGARLARRTAGGLRDPQDARRPVVSGGIQRERSRRWLPGCVRFTATVWYLCSRRYKRGGTQTAL